MSEVPPPSRPKAYSYLRFSTPEQMEGDSLRRQTSLAADYARRHGLELDTKLTFQDLGVSAFRSLNANVGRLADFLEAVSVGQVPQGSYLLVESLDRISRDHAFDAQHTLSGMIMQGVTVVTLLDERVYSREGLQKDPMGMMYSIMGFMRANEESAVKSRRLKQAWVGKRATLRSKPLTAIVPAWLTLDTKSQRIVSIPERAAIVARVFEMTLNGIGQHAIAAALNAEDVEPWGSGRRKGVRWHRSYIAKILTNPAVIGTYVPHEMEHRDGQKRRIALEPVEDYFPAVVSQEVWADVQALLGTKGAPRGRQATAPLSNVLARLAACPICGKTMTRVQKGPRSVPSLVCTAAKVRAGCTYKSVRYGNIEDAILRRLPEAISDRSGLQALEDVEETLRAIDWALPEHDEKIEAVLDMLVEQRSPALQERLRALEEQRDAMRAKQRVLRDQQELLAGAVVGSRIERAIENLKPTESSGWDRSSANLALRGLFKRAVINWPAGTIDLEWHVGGVCRIKYAMGQQEGSAISEVMISSAA